MIMSGPALVILLVVGYFGIDSIKGKVTRLFRKENEKKIIK